MYLHQSVFERQTFISTKPQRSRVLFKHWDNQRWKTTSVLECWLHWVKSLHFTSRLHPYHYELDLPYWHFKRENIKLYVKVFFGGCHTRDNFMWAAPHDWSGKTLRCHTNGSFDRQLLTWSCHPNRTTSRGGPLETRRHLRQWPPCPPGLLPPLSLPLPNLPPPNWRKTRLN